MITTKSATLNQSALTMPENSFGDLLIVKVDSAISCLKKARLRLQELRTSDSATKPFTSMYFTFEPLLVSVDEQ